MVGQHIAKLSNRFNIMVMMMITAMMMTMMLMMLLLILCLVSQDISVQDISSVVKTFLNSFVDL